MEVKKFILEKAPIINFIGSFFSATYTDLQITFNQVSNIHEFFTIVGFIVVLDGIAFLGLAIINTSCSTQEKIMMNKYFRYLVGFFLWITFLLSKIFLDFYQPIVIKSTILMISLIISANS